MTPVIMRASVLSKAIAVATPVLLSGCGGGPALRPIAFPPGCEIVQAPQRVEKTITVALPAAVEPGSAPWAQNAGEQLVFSHLYETLFTVDCFNEIHAGLAESWESGKGGRRWTFELRDDARFWDGTPVTAHDVASCWQDALTLNTVIDSARAAGEHTLHVYLKRRHRQVPRTLSGSVFAVTRSSDDPRWLLGSGPYRPEHGFQEGDNITVRSSFGRRDLRIEFIATSTDDARDLLQGPIDVMVTADPAVLDYAEGQPQLIRAALPWDRTYLLLSTSRVESLERGDKVGDVYLRMTESLARDAVRGDARGYRSPGWWEDLDCELQRPLTARRALAASGPRRIVYHANDRVARDLAERVVALATTDPTASPEAAAIARAVPGLTGGDAGVIAEGLPPRELTASLQRGQDFAYIVSVSRRPPDPCYEAGELLNRAPWLSRVGDDFSRAPVPLVDTRRHVIAKRDRCGLVVDWYGNILIIDRRLGQ